MTYNTQRKKDVLDFFRSHAGESFSVDQVCIRLLKNGSGKSSVYRITADLCNAGILKKISADDGKGCLYQFIGGTHCSEHLHLKCKGCGKVIHLDESTSHKVEESLKAAGGFELEEGSLLFGKCGNCQAYRQPNGSDSGDHDH